MLCLASHGQRLLLHPLLKEYDMVWPTVLANECKVACELARAGGQLARSMRGQGPVQQKSNATPVTDADLAVDKLIQNGLASAFPWHGLLSEEHEDDGQRLSQDWVWIIDPIDGTRAYIHGGPEWAIQIALSYRGRLQLGVVYQPDEDELWLGCPGWGLWRSTGGVWQVFRPPPIQGLRFMRSRSTRNSAAYTALGHCLPGWTAITSSSVGIKVANMLTQGVPAYVHPCRINEWDYAAPIAVLLAAGGFASSWQGQALQFNQQQPHCSALLMSWNWPHWQLVQQLQAVSALIEP